MIEIPTLDASSYSSHKLHSDDSDWPETNCYVDLWIELLHALDLDPVAGMAFTLSTGFDGEQWQFFKYPLEDLEDVYGIRVYEMNAWRPLTEHIERHLGLGHLLTIEADSWFLPDTAGVSYRLAHQKSSIVPLEVDAARRRLTYMHSRGCHELSGDDFDGALQVSRAPETLPPYVEVIDLAMAERRPAQDLRAIASGLLERHLARRPPENPIERLSARIDADIAWLRSEPADVFHGYAFGTLRQCGAWASCAAAFTEWIDLTNSATGRDEFARISELAKSCQFKLARAARGRDVDLHESFAEMALVWERAYKALEECGAK